MRTMAPPAATQVTEALVKLGAGIFLSLHCVRMGYAQYALDNMVFGVPVESAQQALTVIAPRAAAAAICGVTISTAAGSLYMALRWLATSRGTAASKGNILRLSRQLLRVAFPVCLGALVINLTSVIDLFSVMNRLGAAVSSGLPALIASHPGAGLGNMPETEIPNFLYGSYTGLAVTVFNLIPAMTASLGVSALPMMSALHAKGQRARLRLTVESILRVTAMVAVPAGMGLAVMARPILLLLFTQNPAETAVAAPLLQMLGAAVMFVAVAAPICSMLQAVGKVYTPVGLMLLGGSAKLTVNFLLVASPSINIKGAPVGTLLCYLIFMLGGVSALMRAVQTDINLVGIFAKPLAGGSVCCAVAYGSYRWLFGVSQNRLSVIPAVALGGCCYLGVLLLLRAFDENDLAL
ncbi:MAG: oligosaccharide flippase family protein, partial [Oscillospiraceae bacterium]